MNTRLQKTSIFAVCLTACLTGPTAPHALAAQPNPTIDAVDVTDDAHREYALDRFEGYVALGQKLRDQGDYPAAHRAFEDALRLSRSLSNEESENDDLKRYVTAGLNYVGDGLFSAEDYAGAKKSYAEAMSITERLLADDANNVLLLVDLLISQSQLAMTHERLEERNAAQPLLRKSVDVAHAITQAEPDHWDYRLNYALSQQRLAAFLQYGEGPQESLDLLISATPSFREWLDESPDDIARKHSLANQLYKLGDSYKILGRLGEGRKTYEESIALFREIAASAPDDPRLTGQLAATLLRFVLLLEMQGDWATAVTLARQAHAINLKRVASNSANDRYKADLSRSFQRVGVAEMSLGRNKAALSALQESLKLTRQLSNATPNDIERKREMLVTLMRMAVLQESDERIDDAQTTLNEHIRVCTALAKQHPDSLRFERGLASCHQRMGGFHFRRQDGEKAAQSFRTALELLHKSYEPSDVRSRRELATVQGRLAGALFVTGKHAEAQTMLGEALKEIERLASASPDDVHLQRELATLHFFLEEFGPAPGEEP